MHDFGSRNLVVYGTHGDSGLDYTGLGALLQEDSILQGWVLHVSVVAASVASPANDAVLSAMRGTNQPFHPSVARLHPS